MLGFYGFYFCYVFNFNIIKTKRKLSYEFAGHNVIIVLHHTQVHRFKLFGNKRPCDREVIRLSATRNTWRLIIVPLWPPRGPDAPRSTWWLMVVYLWYSEDQRHPEAPDDWWLFTCDTVRTRCTQKHLMTDGCSLVIQWGPDAPRSTWWLMALHLWYSEDQMRAPFDNDECLELLDQRVNRWHSAWFVYCCLLTFFHKLPKINVHWVAGSWGS